MTVKFIHVLRLFLTLSSMPAKLHIDGNTSYGFPIFAINKPTNCKRFISVNDPTTSGTIKEHVGIVLSKKKTQKQKTKTKKTQKTLSEAPKIERRSQTKL